MTGMDPINHAVTASLEQWPQIVESGLRLVLALSAGGLIGLEREFRGREAGFRTNALVALGSAIAMVVSLHVAAIDFGSTTAVRVQADPARIAYGVMAGVGFLGAGTIIRVGVNIRGLTTAAAMWCVAALGLAFGMGLYVEGATATLLVLLVLWLFHHVEQAFTRPHRRRIVVRRQWQPGCLAEVMKRFTSPEYRVLDVSVDRSQSLQTVDISLLVSFKRDQAWRPMEQQLLDDADLTLMSTADA